ncbi:hypothetical protein Pfo_012568 [Paulownia fortunei]|nr:hypothetical protein Pfo_012568 [Paulownia fortunei]
MYRAALKGDWQAAEILLVLNPNVVCDRITKRGETALHVAAAFKHKKFVRELVKWMSPSDLSLPDAYGYTAFCYAAASGIVEIAAVMREKNESLLTIRCEDRTPLYMAALLGNIDMVSYLLLFTRVKDLSPKEWFDLLLATIRHNMYGLALSIVGQYKMLALVEDSNGETPLQVLAKKPLALVCGRSQQGLWGSIASKILPDMKLKTHDIFAPCDAYTLLGCLWDIVIRHEDVETAQDLGNSSKLFFVAAESGNDDFLVELISRYPDFLYKVNASKHSIFHIAVLHRHVQVFNLLYELGGVKDLIATYIDEDGNNMLHLAARLAPQNQLNCIPGAALQMQREVLWYKEVEKIVQPLYRNMKNTAGQTPSDLFLAEHENLMKEGEKLMKQTAKSCMLVTMLIATVVFTTAFTVPGGYNNNTGAPILKNEKLFMVFPISEAVATLSSLTSMLMFLSILTSRYSDNDFLNSLPFWLVVGVAALFVSIVAMMVAFCTCLLFYQHGLAAITVLLVFFASVPIIFIILKYPLLVAILRCTHGCRWLFRSNNKLFS